MRRAMAGGAERGATELAWLHGEGLARAGGTVDHKRSRNAPCRAFSMRLYGRISSGDDPSGDEPSQDRPPTRRRGVALASQWRGARTYTFTTTTPASCPCRGIERSPRGLLVRSPRRRVGDEMSSYTALIDGEAGAYGVYFPDLPGCTAMGATLDDAIANAA